MCKREAKLSYTKFSGYFFSSCFPSWSHLGLKILRNWKRKLALFEMFCQYFETFLCWKVSLHLQWLDTKICFQINFMYFIEKLPKKHYLLIKARNFFYGTCFFSSKFSFPSKDTEKYGNFHWCFFIDQKNCEVLKKMSLHVYTFWVDFDHIVSDFIEVFCIEFKSFLPK